MFFVCMGNIAYRKTRTTVWVILVLLSYSDALWLQLVAFLSQPLCPLCVGLGLVEMLIGDGLANVDLEVLSACRLHHLAGQEDEADVELHAQFAAYPFKCIERGGVAPVKVHGHYVALGIYTLLYHALFPLNVLNLAIYVARAESGRETDDLCFLVVIGILQHLHVSAFLPAHGVYGQEHALQRFDVHEQVVDNHLYLGEEVSEYGYVGDTVKPSQRVVAHQHVVPVLVQVIHTLYGVCYLHVFRKGFGKGGSIIVSEGCDGVVHLLLADEPFQHADDEGGYLVFQFRSLAGYGGFEVYQLHWFQYVLCALC